VSRARDVIPHLMNHGEVDLLLSGKQSDVSLMYSVRFRKDGLTFTFGKKGGIDFFDSIINIHPFKLIRDIRSCPVENYDLVLNDFEPISAWACKRRHMRCTALSHQSSFFSEKTPRPEKISSIAEFILRHYAPATDWFGFHFQPYDENIFTPVIRSAARHALIHEQDHIAVYLPSYDDATIINHLKPLKQVRWEIFSKRVDHVFIDGNISLCRVNDAAFIQSVATSCGVLTGGGFETPSEVLYMGKKLLSVPMTNQYEQLCNSAALKQMGVRVLKKIDDHFTSEVHDWLMNDEAVKVIYPDQTAEIISKIVLSAVKKVA